MTSPRLSWRRQWQDWTDPAPIAKHSTTFLFFAMGILITAWLPGSLITDPSWYILGVIVQAVATMVAVVISPSRAWWRFELVVPWLSVLSLACLRVGTGSETTPLLGLSIFPVLWFAQREGALSMVWVALAALIALVLPVLAFPPANFLYELGLGLFGTAVLLAVGYIFNRASSASRSQVRALNELADVREARLKETVDYTTRLEKSEIERRSAERMLRGVWAAVTEQVVIGTDPSGTIDAWNPGAQKLLGPSATEVEYHRNVTEFHAASELSEHAAALGLDSKAAGVNGFGALISTARRGEAEIREWTYLHENGNRIPVQLSVTPRIGDDGEIVGFLFVAHDLTSAKEVAKLKDQFVGLISHELRTPLSSILGYLELLRDEDEVELTENQLQYLGVAERNAHRLLQLVGDLLFTAQVESGVFRLDAQTLDLGPIVTAALESARPAAAAAGITVVASIAEGIQVAGDPVRLAQTVDNLVSNAIKFTPRGGTVTASLSAAGGEAIVSVSDTGVGIPAAELDQLFSRFFRATTATANAVPGVGLGLTITKAIVAAHRGRMDVESDEGSGTRFTIGLPLVEAPAEAT